LRCSAGKSCKSITCFSLTVKEYYIMDIIRMEREAVGKSGAYGVEERTSRDGDPGQKTENFEKENGARRWTQSQNPHASKTEACGTASCLAARACHPPTRKRKRTSGNPPGQPDSGGRIHSSGVGSSTFSASVGGPKRCQDSRYFSIQPGPYAGCSRPNTFE
jgi:hypothetical protein